MGDGSSDDQRPAPGAPALLHDDVKSALGIFDGAAGTCQPIEGRPCPRCDRLWPFESCFCCLYIDD
eukprot:9098142-Lingulodinium_polyedra.AAC.1